MTGGTVSTSVHTYPTSEASYMCRVLCNTSRSTCLVQSVGTMMQQHCGILARSMAPRARSLLSSVTLQSGENTTEGAQRVADGCAIVRSRLVSLRRRPRQGQAGRCCGRTASSHHGPRNESQSRKRKPSSRMVSTKRWLNSSRMSSVSSRARHWVVACFGRQYRRAIETLTTTENVAIVWHFLTDQPLCRWHHEQQRAQRAGTTNQIARTSVSLVVAWRSSGTNSGLPPDEPALWFGARPSQRGER